jgi:hypothetical protein
MLLKAIVGVEIVITRLVGKSKPAEAGVFLILNA